MREEIENIQGADDSEHTNPKWLLGILLAVLLLVVGSIVGFVGYSNHATQDAVHDISIFYLEELSSNVSQVFKTHFDGYFKELRLAMLATKEAELKNQMTLSAHLRDMAERGEFLYYALLDEDGNVYISDQTYLSEYLVSFLSEGDFDGEGIVLEDKADGEDVFIIAQSVPTEDITILNGRRIVAGAKGIAKSKVRTEVLLRNESNNAFVNMITADGTYIIAGDNTKLVESDNYFDDLAQVAEFSENSSLETMMQDIQMRQDGSVTYYVDGVRHYTYYAFLPRSGWAIAVTLQFGIVSAMLDHTSTAITMAGILLMLVVVAVVSGVLYVYFRQKRLSMEMNLKRIEAEESNRAKSSFLSSMSHDIRTPMNAIIGFTNLAMQQENHPKVQSYLTKISTSSAHLLSLINDVLDMSRIESGKMNIDEIECSLADILHGLHTIIQGQVDAKQQHLCMDVIDVVDEQVWCDKMRLNQVLLNFLSNAVKFTPVGGDITVRLIQKECSRKGYGAYAFHVKDTGIGMSEEFSKKVFEPFERERSTTVNGIQGTGLGMSIAKNIVDMMGGTVRVETALGKGTEFIVNLELRLQEDAELLSPDLQGMRVVVMNQDASASENVLHMLRQLGVEAEWMNPGKETAPQMEQHREQPYQLVIADGIQPDSNGLELLRQIRQSAGEDTPMLLMTSYSWDEVQGEAAKAGVTAVCNQPVFLSDLSRLLLELTGQAAEDAPETQEDVTMEQFEGKRILLAEDNELNREIALEILQGCGFIVEAVENGKMALETLSASQPGHYDVILMDVQMPVMDGYEAAKAIRKLKNPALANVPILAMTANAFEEDKQTSLAAGMNGHITKPIDIGSLLEMLKQNLA